MCFWKISSGSVFLLCSSHLLWLGMSSPVCRSPLHSLICIPDTEQSVTWYYFTPLYYLFVCRHFNLFWIYDIGLYCLHWKSFCCLNFVSPLKIVFWGRLGGSVGWASDFTSGHDLAVCGFKPRIGLCADNSAWSLLWILCFSLSLCPSPARALSLKNK